MFRDKVKINDVCTIVGNPYIPSHTEAKIIELDRANGIARVEYTLKGQPKSRNVEINDICPPLADLMSGLKECFEALIRVS